MAELATIWWGLVLLGLVAGVLSGALGVGSGIVLIPVLVIFFAVPQKSAQGTALAVMAPMALLGAFRYWHHPDIELNFWAVAILAGGALVGTYIGTELAGRLPAPVLRRLFAIFVLAAGLRLLLVPGKAHRAETGRENGTVTAPAAPGARGEPADR